MKTLTDTLIGISVTTAILLLAVLINLYYYRKWLIVLTIIYFAVKSYLYSR